MNPTNTYAVVFSPTGTSKKIACAVAHGVNGGIAENKTVLIDYTHSAAEVTCIPSDAVALFAVPVYGGKVAPTALKRIERIRGEGTPAVIVVVYGNRDIGQAAVQLATFVAQRGFVPVAAAAFVGEHSYSTSTHPVASGRPDTEDLLKAEAFGASVCEKLGRGDLSPVDSSRLKAPRTPFWPLLRFIGFVLRYRRQQKRRPVVLLPATDVGKCTHCGLCAAICPVEAIVRGEEERTDPSRCIRCNACVKRCPVGARSFDTPFAAALARSFQRRKESVTLL